MFGNLAVSFAATSGSAILALTIRDWLITRRRNKRMRDLYVAEVERNRRKMILNQLTAEAHENGWDITITEIGNDDLRVVISAKCDTENGAEHVYNICDSSTNGRHVHRCLCGSEILQN